MESRVVFERNLAALRKRDPVTAAALEAASAEGIEIEVGPRGAQVFRHKGVRLGSAYDPAREGLQIAESMAEQPADVMVAIGFGLGEQFEPYLECNPATLIIYEPSVERLRAALERISIVNLLASYRDLYIVCDLERFGDLVSVRYVSGLRMRVFPHPAVLRLDAKAVSDAVALTLRRKSTNDSQIATSIEMLMPWAWITANNGARIARTPNLSRLAGAFANRPAVIVAAGPSLDKQLPVLREFQDQVVIIAIGQTVKALRGAGIEPHLVHVLESQDVSHQLTGAGDTEELCTAYTPDCHSAIFDVPTRATFCAIAESSPMGKWIADASGEGRGGFTTGGGTVAQGAVGLAMVLGCNPISLIGQDLAFTDGRVYANDSAYDFVSVNIDEQGACRFGNMKRKAGLLKHDVEAQDDQSRVTSAVWVDRWDGEGKVATWPAYAVFIDQYRDMGRYLAKRDVRLVNCTEGGARIDGLEHLPFQEFLSNAATGSLDARTRILEAYDSFEPRTLSTYEEALAESRRLLTKVEGENKKGLRFVKKVAARLENARSDQQRLDILRGLARHEKRVRRLLERVPWLDSLVQPEIYNTIAGLRRTERQDPTDEELAEESSYLFHATRNGIERARKWFDAFETSFDASSDASPEIRSDTPVEMPPEFTGRTPGAGASNSKDERPPGAPSAHGSTPPTP